MGYSEPTWKPQDAAGAIVDQPGDLVAMPLPFLEHRQDHQVGAAALQLGVCRHIWRDNIASRRIWQVVGGLAALAGSRVRSSGSACRALQFGGMLSGLLIVLAAAVVTFVVSRFMWWACRRSAAWSMAAGAILAVLALGGAVVIAWLMTRAWYGS